MDIKKRKYFKESQRDIVHYYFYQPIVINIANWCFRNSITPNFISILRLIVIFIFLIILYTIPKKKNIITKILLIMLTIIVFLFGGLTDDLDGYIARKFNLKSSIGQKLDFFVDINTMIIIIIFSLKFLSTQEKIIVLLLIFFVVIYKKLEEKRRKISNVINFFSHIWIIYIFIISYIICKF